MHRDTLQRLVSRIDKAGVIIFDDRRVRRLMQPVRRIRRAQIYRLKVLASTPRCICLEIARLAAHIEKYRGVPVIRLRLRT